jgi:hypothetical protein
MDFSTVVGVSGEGESAALVAYVAAVAWLVILNFLEIEHTLDTLIGNTENPIHTLVLWVKIQMLVLISQYFY